MRESESVSNYCFRDVKQIRTRELVSVETKPSKANDIIKILKVAYEKHIRGIRKSFMQSVDSMKGVMDITQFKLPKKASTPKFLEYNINKYINRKHEELPKKKYVDKFVRKLPHIDWNRSLHGQKRATIGHTSLNSLHQKTNSSLKIDKKSMKQVLNIKRIITESEKESTEPQKENRQPGFKKARKKRKSSYSHFSGWNRSQSDAQDDLMGHREPN